jgi:hypothetical protein
MRLINQKEEGETARCVIIVDTVTSRKSGRISSAVWICFHVLIKFDGFKAVVIFLL